MERKRLCQGVVWLVAGVSAVWLANSAAAQETLGRGRTPAQTFASDCAVCHKSPQGLARSAGGFFGVEGFLREHYTSSRESAVALANYLRSVDSGPARARRAAKMTRQSPTSGKRREPNRPRPRDPTGSPMAQPVIPSQPTGDPPISWHRSGERPRQAKQGQPRAWASSQGGE